MNTKQFGEKSPQIVTMAVVAPRVTVGLGGSLTAHTSPEDRAPQGCDLSAGEAQCSRVARRGDGHRWWRRGWMRAVMRPGESRPRAVTGWMSAVWRCYHVRR